MRGYLDNAGMENGSMDRWMRENDARVCMVDLGMQDMSLAGWEGAWRMQGWGVDRFVDIG